MFWKPFSVLLLTTLSTFAAPPNDSWLQPTEIIGNTLVLTADLGGATRDAFEPENPDLLGQTVWWRWTATESGVIGWNSTNSPNPVHVSVLTIDPFDQWETVAESYLRPQVADGGFFGNPLPVLIPEGSFVAKAGTVYWLRVDGVRTSGPFGPFPGHDPLAPYPVHVPFQRLTDPPPPGDTFAQRIRLSVVPSLFSATLTTATSEPDEPAAHPKATGRTVWWEWTPPGRGTARIEIVETNQSPLVVVYRRSPWQQLETVASSATEFGNECRRFWRARRQLEWDTAPATTYFIQTDGFPEFNRSLPFQAQLQFTPAPTNDLIVTPAEVAGLDWAVTTSNAGATRTPEEPSVPGGSRDSSVWFRWSLPSRGLIEVTLGEPTVFAEPGVEILPPPGSGTTGSIFTTTVGPCTAAFADLNPIPPFEPVFSVFRRFGSSGDLPLLEYQTHGTNGVWAEIAGDEAWIQLDGPQGTSGSASFKAHLTPPPSNDNRAQRIVLPSHPVRVTGRTAGATTEPSEFLPNSIPVPQSGSSVPKRTVWWEWQAPSTGTWALQITTGAYDHYFLIYRGTPEANASPTAQSLLEPVYFTAAAGETFQIGVFGVAGLGSNLDFRIVQAAVPNLGVPVPTWDGAGRLFWVFGGLKGSELPFTAETSTNLIHWTPTPTDWYPRAESFRVQVDPIAPAFFIRLRVGP